MKRKSLFLIILLISFSYCFAQSEKTEAYQDSKVPFRLFETRNNWNYIKLFKIPKELITEDLYQKYKKKIDSSNLFKEADDLFIDLKGELYIKTDVASYYQLQIKIPELVKD